MHALLLVKYEQWQLVLEGKIYKWSAMQGLVGWFHVMTYIVQNHVKNLVFHEKEGYHIGSL